MNDRNPGNGRSQKVLQVTLCMPKRGPPGSQARSIGVKGQPLVSFLVREEDANLFAGSAQIYTRDQHLPVTIWLGDRDITPKGMAPLEPMFADAPPRAPGAPLADHTTPPVPVGDTESAVLQHHIAEQRAQLAALKADRQSALSQRAVQRLIKHLIEPFERRHPALEPLDRLRRHTEHRGHFVAAHAALLAQM